MMVQAQVQYQNNDLDNEDIKALQDEIIEMKENLDRKEYLLQYCEQRNTEMEKLLKKRAMHDDYIKKRLEGLSIEPDKERTITNIVEDNTILKDEVTRLKSENKSLREQLDYAMSNAGGNEQMEMSIFATNMKPTPQMHDLERIKSQSKNKDLYLYKLEEMLKSNFSKIDKLKEELSEAKTQNTFSMDKNSNLIKLNEQLKKAMVKYKTKSEELEDKFKDKNVTTWVKENTGGIMRVKPSDIVANVTNDGSDESEGIDEVDINVDENSRKDGGTEQKPKMEEKVVDEFAPEKDSFDEKNGDDKEDMIGMFPDESSIMPNVNLIDDDGHDSDPLAD